MKRNNVIALVLALITIFIVLFSWCLHRTCQRLVSAEVHELMYQQDLEAQRPASGDDSGHGNGNGNGNGRGNGNGNGKSRAG
jgi:hypothetical protein